MGYPIPDGYTGFKIGNGANGTQIILDDIVSCKNAITNQSGFLRFWNDDFDPTGAGGSWGYMYEQNRFGINKFYTNNYQYIPLDMPILIIDSKTFLTSPCVPVSPLTQFVVPVVRAGGGNIYDITIKVSGHNPYGRTITISNQVALNFTQTSVSGATFPTATARQTYSIGSESLTKNAIPYVGYVFNSTGTGVNYLYSASAISVWNIFQPVGQLTWVITPDNTGNEIDTYVITIDFNRTENTLTGVTRAARTSNLDGSFITLVGTGIVAATSRFSGTGTLTLSTTPTNTLLTTTRSEGIGGDDGDKLRINYNNTLVSASTLQTINPVVAGTYYPLFTSSSAASGAAGITVYTNPTTSMLSINTTTSEVNINNLKVNILNLVYTRAISAQNNASELNCFTGSFTEYEVRLVITTTTPSSIYGTPLLFRFATSVGTPITTNYSGRAVFLSGTTNAFDTWSTGAYITDIQPAIPDSVYSWTVTNPNSAKRKTIKGTNNSFVSGLDSPCISTGQFTLATAYNSCAWDTTSAPGLLITGNIYIYGVH